MRFAKKYTLQELAELTQATLIGDSSHVIYGVEDLSSATSEDVSFLSNPKYKEAMQSSCAGIICVGPDISLSEGRNYLISSDPSRAFQTIMEALLTAEHHKTGFEGIHPTAVIHPTAHLGKNVQIGPYATLDQGVDIGDGTYIGSHVSIGPGVSIGTGCILHPHVVVRERCQIHNRVIIQPGAVIGSCGFGYITNAMGKHIKVDQLGIVILEDDVEIGANTTIDRARFKATHIARGTKIDNLVQIAHNVILGEDNIIISQSGIAGSVTTGKHVIVGGQAGIVGHLEITDGVMIATRGGVSKSLTKPGKYAGSPVMGLSDHNRQQVHLRKIGSYVKQIESLEERLKALESS